MNTDTETKPEIEADYFPKVGDRFHKPAGVYISLLDADPIIVPERNAVVETVSESNVEVIIDAEKCTMPLNDFVLLAKNTLKNGSTLIRS